MEIPATNLVSWPDLSTAWMSTLFSSSVTGCEGIRSEQGERKMMRNLLERFEHAERNLQSCEAWSYGKGSWELLRVQSPDSRGSHRSLAFGPVLRKTRWAKERQESEIIDSLPSFDHSFRHSLPALALDGYDQPSFPSLKYLRCWSWVSVSPFPSRSYRDRPCSHKRKSEEWAEKER